LLTASFSSGSLHTPVEPMMAFGVRRINRR